MKDIKIVLILHIILLARKFRLILEDYSIFANDNYLFAVKAARANIEEILDYAELPTSVNALILPYKDCIIIDGVISRMPIGFGPEIRKKLANRLLSEKIILHLDRKN